MPAGVTTDDLLKGWATAKVHEIALKVGSGATPTGGEASYKKSGVPLIRSMNVHFDGFREEGLAYLDDDQAADLANVEVRARDVLLNITGASIGRVTLAPEHLDGARVNQHVCIIRPVEIVDSSFVRWFLASPRQQSLIFQVEVGATRQALTKDMVLNFDVPIPPLAEQRRIVAKVEELFSDLDAGVAALERVRAGLKRYRASVLKAAVEGRLTADWRAAHLTAEPASELLSRVLSDRRAKWEADQQAKFAASGKPAPKNWQAKYAEPPAPDTANLPPLPQGWVWASVDQLSEIQGGIQKQPSRKPVENKYPFLRVANVHRDRLELDDVHEIELFANELERLRLLPGDLLIVEGNGSQTEIGRSAIWNGSIADCVHQNHIIRVRFLAGLPRYLNTYWNSPQGNGRVMQQAASTSGLYTLSVSKVSALPVPLPPLAEQEQIVAAVEERLSIAAATERQVGADLARAGRLRQAILKRAFAGKLVPQDPTDEPASALLARLRAARADAPPARKPKRGSARPADGVS